MSKYEEFIDAFTRLGIQFNTVSAFSEYGRLYQPIEQGSEIVWDVAIEIPEGHGYSGFYCLFCFNGGEYVGHAVRE